MAVQKILKNKIHYLPVLGIILYVVLYSIADQLYAQSLDNFSFHENLLCDMMQEESNKGYRNMGRPVAITGHVFLAIGMTTFFYILPTIFSSKNINVKAFQLLGMLSMSVFVLLATKRHDYFVFITGCLGTAALIPLAIEYFKLGVEPHSLYGILCIILSLMVFFSYQFKICIDSLPVFQKAVFVFDSLWVVWVCVRVRDLNKLSFAKAIQ